MHWLVITKIIKDTPVLQQSHVTFFRIRTQPSRWFNFACSLCLEVGTAASRNLMRFDSAYVTVTVFSTITPYWLVSCYRRILVTPTRHLYREHAGSKLLRNSVTYYQPTRLKIPEENEFHKKRWQNFKPHNWCIADLTCLLPCPYFYTVKYTGVLISP